MKSILSLILSLSFSTLMLGYDAREDISQNIKGRVLDQQSQMPLPGVNVLVEIKGQTYGASTDFDGYYKVESVPTGRINIQFSFIGYQNITMNNIELLGSKELILNVSMRESTETLDEIVVSAKTEKTRTQNERVNVSGRTFSIEESQRFAGANNDVSRMAANFAGVQRANDATNDIVIRGNSPFGLIWRLEGMDIPNPNHFGGIGATGGPVSMLNNNVLANSDFITSAFPSDYGDGISGVFDLRMRNGNYEKHEFLGQIGFNGFEFGAEGPINKERKSSYLLNYRYSTLGVFSALGIDFGTGTAIPQYQDLNLKLNFPSRKLGTIQVFALGGVSAIDFLDSENDEDEDGGFYSDDEDLRNRVNSGVIGASHQYFYSPKTYSKVSLAYSGIQNKTSIDTFNVDGTLSSAQYRQNFVRSNFQVNALLNHKFNVKHVVRVGAYITRSQYDLNDSAYRYDWDRFVNLRDLQGSTMMYQPYANWQYRFNDEWEMNTGIHTVITEKHHSIEPRWGMSYRPTAKSSFNIGYGLHSQQANELLLYREEVLQDGSSVRPNENLDLVKSHHFVLGYQQNLGGNWNFKAETYYQHIYDAIVSVLPNSYSSVNSGSFDFRIPDTAQNAGLAYNYGLDLTLEKFMDRGFYMLNTISIFESKYRGNDQVWRNTAFNGNFVWNLVGGKEFVLSKPQAKSRKTLTVDAKVTLAGGQRYTPIDLVASIADGEAVYDNSRAFGEQYDPYFRADIRIGYKIAGSRFTQEWAIDVQNVTNQDNPFGQDFNAATGTIETTNQLGLFPMFLYRITF
ncbi:TonB-dependent receptor [Croceimicrobium hydrocarbonivorans]|uniref:TonB-dependent receptor n=1 Tax=Croceimicrobium hydrocarbonivorans TaxID=2761580 RepID=A0A7H0VH41_9FLAO|nr:TonB-dependent receptor [Croceimicrobium hydrocarbonivorans]QNR25039.1 TonB-dependent receptor [Croceimicrobium hydrocarbonivorans]